ncbi:MAG: MerR family transcriptional regulator, partial [bacterium]|nr:MerR family transcriptional regulator [bacterium]
MTDPVALPEGQEFFKLNEVCKLANVQPYMLRFWGTEFGQLETKKTGTGQRLYSRAQVELILEVRHLLFEDGLTIAGAKKRIKAMEESGETPKPRPKPKTRADKKAEKKESAPGPTKEQVQKEVDKQVAKHTKPLVAALTKVRGAVVK